jgi:hypothetical protein
MTHEAFSLAYSLGRKAFNINMPPAGFEPATRGFSGLK